MKNSYTKRDGKVYIDIRCQGRTLQTIISESDFEKVDAYSGSWFGRYDHKSSKIYVYITAREKDEKGRTKTKWHLLHRVILGVINEPEFVVDHLNHNSLDNTRENLRATSPQRNTRRKNEDRSRVCKQGKTWNVYAHEELVGKYETREEACVMAIVANVKYFPELTRFMDFDSQMRKLGYDYATVPIKIDEHGEADITAVDPKNIRRYEKG